MGGLQKDIILNGTESLVVYKDNGVVWRASDIASYTPIVFRDIEASKTKRFDLHSVISKDYQVIGLAIDAVGDDDVKTFPEQPAAGFSSLSFILSIVKNNKRKEIHQINSFNGLATKVLILSPQDELRINTYNNALNSITFYCQPVYLEQTIVVPEGILDESNYSGDAGDGTVYSDS